ncbi:MAG: 3-hydroxyacyl-CoA dehydrogenase/enoyl-CoA hydratase family protein [Acidobacteria bacterium]|nr:3-hydroxyacyl-CoA dehydrogenase/enoyl-CoA hydratase family protein [Acidobacteriota bacterium]
MKRKIKKAAVIGSGVMGSGIAAHLAGAGIPVVMLDIVPKDLKEGQSRSVIAEISKKKLLKQKPSPIFNKTVLTLIETGNLEDDLDKLKDCDWIVEVIVENVNIKKMLFKNITPYLKKDAILTSNTSGIPIKMMTEDFDEGLKKRFLVTHFFNPVRYMKLLEIIPGELTDPELIEFMKDFGENTLGKGVVLGKDTPNFVGNRVGVFALANAMRVALEDNLTPQQVDSVLGKAMSRPGSAVFGTNDLVGIDTMVHVVKNSYEALVNDEMRETFKMPEFIEKMMEKGLLGRKVKRGFFTRDKNKQKLQLDLKTMEYVPAEKPDWKCIKKAKEVSDAGERIKVVIGTDDPGGKLAWKNTAATLIYSLNRLGEIADDIVNIDNGMKWGFNWDLGPFEVWDAIGVKESAERMKADGFDVPEKLNILLENAETFYKTIDGDRYYFDFAKKDYVKVPVRDNVIFLNKLKATGKVLAENEGADILNIGDGVICLTVHTKMNTVDDKVIEMLNRAVDMVEDKYEALVIGSQAQHFGAGANIFMLLQSAQEGRWWEVEEMTKAFQDANMRLKYCEKPVVTAPYGLTLGGACEITMHGHRAVAAVETYIGLVEVGVGLLPAGGGTKELLIRTLNDNRIAADPMTATQKVFETIGMAKVATSAREAREIYGHLRPTDMEVMNGDSQIYYAKQAALSMVREGFRPRRAKETVKVAGKVGYTALILGLTNMLDGGYISEHDMLIGSKIAHVLTGGGVPEGTIVGEDRLLELEREAFVELTANPKSQARIEHMLKTGKPLRN